MQSNLIGLRPDKSAASAVGNEGIDAQGCTNLTIGGGYTGKVPATGPPSPDRGNLIANCKDAVHLSNCKTVTVSGNLLGWDGTQAWGNANAGVLSTASGGALTADGKTMIGGWTTAEGNRLCQNVVGVHIRGGGGISLLSNQITRSRLNGALGGFGLLVQGPTSVED